MGLAAGPSEEIVKLIDALLVVDPDQRPDVGRVAELIAPRLVSALEDVGATQHTLLESVAQQEDARQRAILQGALGREARARLRTRARTAAASPKRRGRPRTASGEESELRALHGTDSGADIQWERATLPTENDSGARGLISIPAAELREISDPTTGLLSQLQQILRVCELPPTSVRDDSERRGIIGRYQRFLVNTRPGILKTEVRAWCCDAQKFMFLKQN